ncbi:MAG: GAF domain-containing protein, partial [Myxococcales bacterium]|nr:GAF domain-containing protein [Myxococcales bacterium]
MTARRNADLERRVAELEAVIADQEHRLAGMARIAANLASSRDPRKAMRAMVAEISNLLQADRTTIYELRRDEGILRGLAVQGETSLEVGIPIGEGIAGEVALRGKPINLKDAYRHPKFDPKYDKLTGYRTRSMLAVPMRNPKREVTGVVQVLNKCDGYFTVEDEHLLSALATQAAITLEALHLQLRLNVSNTELLDLSHRLQQKVHELELLFDNEQAIAEARDLPELADDVLRVTAQVAGCEAAAMFLPDETGYGLTWMRGPEPDGNLRTLCRSAVGEGVLGKCAGRGESFVLREGDFERLGIPRMIGADCGLRVEDAVSAPLLDGERVIGALGLFNRKALTHRDDEADRRLAVLVAGQLSRAVTRMAQRRDAQLRDRMM